MKNLKVRNQLVITSMLLVALMAASAAPSAIAKVTNDDVGANPTTWELRNQGFVYGTVHIGPLCGAISIGPDGQEICGGDPYDILQNITVKAFKEKRGELILVGESSIDPKGFYQMFLPAGKYIIDIDPNHWTQLPCPDGEICPKGPGHVNAPIDIKIKPHSVTRFNINISTGIL